MRAYIQPIVADGQQLIRVRPSRTVQLMVALTKEQAREGFAKRFNEALNETPEVPKDRGRIAWVAKRYRVTGEAARKWVRGEDIPDRANLANISRDLGVNSEWLFAGLGNKRPIVVDALRVELDEVWASLEPNDRTEVLNFARFRMGRPPAPQPPSDPVTIHPRPRHPA